MSELRFADAGWVHGLWALALLLVFLFWLESRGGGALDRLLGRALQGRLLQRPAPWRRVLRVVLLGLAAACCIVALMRPQWGLRYVATPRVGSEIMVCLDVSRSMLAEDVAPNRLERAKAEIVDLLGYLDGDQVGLIAFAGRATVLAPLTPDFGFLRLVLDGVGPHSVSRGGTRLEEPIRKAVAGFTAPGEASRAILLITDGEDHGSFPLDAAQAAAEAGIKIIAIGFGDEAGSEIIVTDPVSAVRTRLLDGDGRPVRSRLDGDLLRELALKTGGAYVPAGTGLLDLESVYEEHIARLTRGRLDPRGRAVRDEGYQWAVLLGLVFLISGAAVSAGPGARAASGLLLAAVLTLPAGRAAAQAGPGAALQPGAEPTQPTGAAAEAAPEPENPRELYNRGVIALASRDPDQARSRFEEARRDARDDGPLRFAASYNLGWAAVERAGSLEEGSPQEALSALHEAADWFREASALRPDDEDSRHNLEVVLRRVLMLEDRLAQQDEAGIQGSLEELVGRQRALLAGVAGLLEQSAAVGAVAPGEALRRAFRARSTEQRTLLSDADALAARVGSEKDSLETKPKEERTPEDAMRALQLHDVLQYLHRSRERMGQARRQLRQRQGQRGYRRGSAALAELKRAQDQLRDPVAVLDRLIGDAAELREATRVLAASRRPLGESAGAERAPAWLASEGLAESQTSLADRTGELDGRLLAGLSRSGEAPPGAESEAFLAAVREAEPFVAAGRGRFERAAERLEADGPGDAIEAQTEGLVALGEARERFLDLRGLIEAATRDQRQIREVLVLEGEAVRAARDEFVPGLRALQARNLERGERLDARLASEHGRAAIAAPPPDPSGGAAPGAAQELEALRRRLELAGSLLTLALGRMDDTQRGLGEVDAPAEVVSWSEAGAAAGQAVEHLEALRRLFFSIVEQVRELAQRQQDLADRTRDAAALAAAGDAQAVSQAGGLLPPQQKLAERAGTVANALEEQSNQEGGVVTDEEEVLETTRRLRKAGEHVMLAQIEMEGAATGFEAEPPALASARERQDAALAELAQALALLAPPPPPQGDQDEQQEQQGEGRQQQPGQDAAESQTERAAQDPTQLLQGVRDREAERRRQRERGPAAGYETVEKDW